MNKILSTLFLTLLVTVSFCTYAQKYGIVKTQAFFRKSKAGNIPIDNAGRPINNEIQLEYLIYIETKGSTLPHWQNAVIDGRSYTLRTMEVKQIPLYLGKAKATNTTISLEVDTGNRLWQLVINQIQTAPAAIPFTGNTPAATLSGTWRGKSFTYKITKMQELAKQFNP